MKLNHLIIIQKAIIPQTPLTDFQVKKTLLEMEDIIRYRLHMSEIIPVEMSRFRIGMLHPLPILPKY